MRNKRTFFRNCLISIHILFAVFGLCLYLINYNTTQRLLLQRELNNEATIAKAGSLSVEDLLTTVQNELNSFEFSFTRVSDSSVVDLKTTQQGFNAYIKRAQLPINGIALYDATGKLAVIEDRQNLHIGEGQDFSKTPFLMWSANPVNRDKVFISTPYIGTVGGSVGKIILIVLKPIYFGNTYKGALGIRILVDDVRKAFIAPLVADSNQDSFIVDTSGILIAGKDSLINKNLFLYAKQQQWNMYTEFIIKLQNAIRADDSQTIWVFQNPNEKPMNLLAGISKINIPNTDKDLFLVVTSPKNNILELLGGLRNYGYIWLGFSVILTVMGSVTVMFLKEAA